MTGLTCQGPCPGLFHHVIQVVLVQARLLFYIIVLHSGQRVKFPVHGPTHGFNFRQC